MPQRLSILTLLSLVLALCIGGCIGATDSQPPGTDTNQMNEGAGETSTSEPPLAGVPEN